MCQKKYLWHLHQSVSQHQQFKNCFTQQHMTMVRGETYHLTLLISNFVSFVWFFTLIAIFLLRQGVLFFWEKLWGILSLSGISAWSMIQLKWINDGWHVATLQLPSSLSLAVCLCNLTKYKYTLYTVFGQCLGAVTTQHCEEYYFAL